MNSKKAKFANSPASQFFTDKKRMGTGQSLPTVVQITPPPSSVQASPTTNTVAPTPAPTTISTTPMAQSVIDVLRSPKPEIKNRRVQVVFTQSFYQRANGFAKQLDVSFNELTKMALDHLFNTLTKTRQ